VTGEPQVGDVLDSRYRITGLLGTGGMGSVYRAEHVTIRRPVAIKVLHPDFADDPDYAKRFEREAFVTGRTDHPNCVTVSDFGPLDGGGFYLVMELVDGVLLADLLDEVGHMPAPRALHIVRHVLRGLGHAHEAGIVHRDIKPANVILLAQDGDADFAKVLDFGIAKLVDAAAAADPASNQLTQIGTTVGTPTYIAPEQAVGGAIDARSDLYSISIMLYEMLTGRPPFQDEDRVKVLAQHLSAPVPPMAELAPQLSISPAVEEVVRRGLAKDRKDRWPSAAAFITAIDDLFARGLVEVPAQAIAPAVAAHAAFKATGLATPVPGSLVVPVSGATPAPMPAVSGSMAATPPPITVTSLTAPAPSRFTRKQLLAGGGVALAAVVLLALALGGGGSARPGMAAAADPVGASNQDQAKPPHSRKGKAGKKPAAAGDTDAARAHPKKSLDRAQQDVLARANQLASGRRGREALSLLDRELGQDAGARAEAQLVYGHAYMADRRPLEGLKSYWRAVELDKERTAGDDYTRRNVNSLVASRSADAAVAALDLLAEIDDPAARKVVVSAALDQRNAVRHRARSLAQSAGYADRIDRLTSHVLDLLHNKTCEERAQAIPILRDLGDQRAIPALMRARTRRTGGFFGLGARSANGCMRAELDDAIAHLERAR
jgi:serine/threonine-protein kinase